MPAISDSHDVHVEQTAVNQCLFHCRCTAKRNGGNAFIVDLIWMLSFFRITEEGEGEGEGGYYVFTTCIVPKFLFLLTFSPRDRFCSLLATGLSTAKRDSHFSLFLREKKKERKKKNSGSSWRGEMDRWCLSLSGQISIVQEAKKKENKSDDGGLSHCLFISIASIHLLFFPFLSFFLVFKVSVVSCFSLSCDEPLRFFFLFFLGQWWNRQSHARTHTHWRGENTNEKMDECVVVVVVVLVLVL